MNKKRKSNKNNQIENNKHSNLLDAINNASNNLILKNKIMLKTKSSNNIHNKNYETENYEQNEQNEINYFNKQKNLIEINNLIKNNEFIPFNQLILPEGMIITEEYFNKNPLYEANNILQKGYLSTEIYNNFILPINLEDEELRENKALNGYNLKYKKYLKDLFRSYKNEVTNTITKSNFLKIFRDKNINNSLINLNELNITIRKKYGENLNELDYNQFIFLLIQFSFLIFTKKRNTLTISECYGFLLRKLINIKKTESTNKLNKRFLPIFDYIKQKIELNENYNLPPGIKIIEVTNVKYKNRTPNNFINLLGESTIICYEILEEIIFNRFNSSIIEPFVLIKKDIDFEIDFQSLKKWSNFLTFNYINLDSKYQKEGIDVCDILEEGLEKLSKNNFVNNYFKEKAIKKEIQFGKEKKKNEKFQKRRIYLKKIVSEREKEKEEKKKQIELENERKMKIKEINKNINKMKREISKKKINNKIEFQNKIKKEEEKKNELLNEDEKKIEEKILQQKLYLNNKKKKLKEQFTKITEERKILLKQLDEKNYLDQIKELKTNISYLNKEKEYNKFEKNLNNSIKNLHQNENVIKIFDKYKNHIKLIYEIYSKIGYNKISFESGEKISINEFREFLTDFIILGIFINNEQMIYIFNKITLTEKKNYLNYDDFEIALIYLTIYSKFSDKNQKITKNVIDNFNAGFIEHFFQYLDFTFPFNRVKIENFINERRSMPHKDLMKIKKQIKKEKIEKYRNLKCDDEENENKSNNNDN